eukprot:4284107-Prymnesium_polylepis.1
MQTQVGGVPRCTIIDRPQQRVAAVRSGARGHEQCRAARPRLCCCCCTIPAEEQANSWSYARATK